MHRVTRQKRDTRSMPRVLQRRLMYVCVVGCVNVRVVSMVTSVPVDASDAFHIGFANVIKVDAGVKFLTSTSNFTWDSMNGIQSWYIQCIPDFSPHDIF